jgi:hypothetical protein
LKLEAFAARYGAALPADAATAWRNFLRAWNGEGEPGATWPAFAAAHGLVGAHAERWAAERARETDLASALVKFCADRL